MRNDILWLIILEKPKHYNKSKGVLKMVYILFKCNLISSKKKEFHSIYEEQMQILEKEGGEIISIWESEMGPCNQLLVLWRAKDMSSYEKILHGLRDNARSLELQEKFRPLTDGSERWLLRPVSYSHLK